jgi:hypothetical protein
MIPTKAYLYGAAVVVVLALAAGIIKQHDARVRAQAVAALWEERADSLRNVADSAWAAKEASDSAAAAQIDSLEAEIAAGQAAIDSTALELPPLQSNVDSLLAVLTEYAAPELQPVVNELRTAVSAERQTSADLFREQQKQIVRLNNELGVLKPRLANTIKDWENERTLRLTLEQQLAAVIDSSKPDLLMDRLVPAVIGASAVLLVDEIVN